MKFLTLPTLSILMLLASSCSQFAPSRDYLSEMERDDAGFYNAGDFPVVAGDTGRTHETSQERRQRTPASALDLQEDRTSEFLKHELRTLEGSESEEGLAFYEQYKPKLKTTSERIYFLKLSHHERREYLDSRGWLSSESRPNFKKPLEERFGVRASSVSMGMSKADVMNTFGRPTRVEVAGNPSHENERWLYSVNGAMKYIYFESGRVEGWE
jgi:hypothetical protein